MASTSVDAPEWGRLARFVQQRRARLGLSQTAAARQAQINRGTWAAIEDATVTKPQVTTFAKIEQVLGWADGSCAEILAGGEPTAGTTDERDGQRPTPAEQFEAAIEIFSDPGLDVSNPLREFVLAELRQRLHALRNESDGRKRA